MDSLLSQQQQSRKEYYNSKPNFKCLLLLRNSIHGIIVTVQKKLIQFSHQDLRDARRSSNQTEDTPFFILSLRLDGRWSRLHKLLVWLTGLSSLAARQTVLQVYSFFLLHPAFFFQFTTCGAHSLTFISHTLLPVPAHLLHHPSPVHHSSALKAEEGTSGQKLNY